MGLAEGSTKSGVLYAELVNESSAFLPATVGLICRSEGGIKKLRSSFKGLDMSGRRK